MLVLLRYVCRIGLMYSIVDEPGDWRGDYKKLNMLIYLAGIMPWNIYYLSAFSVLCAPGIGASNNELIVIQPAGVSIARIIRSAIKPTLHSMLVSLMQGAMAPQT